MSGVVVWFTGLPASGKSTLAAAVRRRLIEEGSPCCLLDSDEVRRAVFPELGFAPVERDRFYERLGDLATLLADQGLVVLAAATAPRRRYRDRVRAAAPDFVEVYLDVPAEECERRDPKGLYAKAQRGEIVGLPGLNARYEPPMSPELRISDAADAEAVETVVAAIRNLTRSL